MIFIDDRIGSKDLIKHMPENSAQLTRLRFGDAMFLGNGPEGCPVHVAMELKTIGDILACIIDGRFSGHQLPGLLAHYHVIYLIIEGKHRPDPRTGLLQVPGSRGWRDADYGAKRWMYRDLDCFLSTMEMKAGIKVRRSYDRKESAQILLAQHHWWTAKDYDEHRAHEAFDISGEPSVVRPSLLRRIAAQLPGIGWQKAQAVEKHFPDVVTMMVADEREWRKIAGVGKTLSLRIIDEIQKQKSRFR